MSSHNPHIALKAVQSGWIDVLMFSINPAHDMEAADTDIYDLMEFKGMEKNGLVVDEARQKLYTACETAGVAITVYETLRGGYSAESGKLAFCVAMTVPQCIQYCLDRNGVKVVIVGCHTVEEVLEAVRYYDVPAAERSYAHIFGTGSAIHMTGAACTATIASRVLPISTSRLLPSSWIWRHSSLLYRKQWLNITGLFRQQRIIV